MVRGKDFSKGELSTFERRGPSKRPCWSGDRRPGQGQAAAPTDMDTDSFLETELFFEQNVATEKDTVGCRQYLGQCAGDGCTCNAPVGT